MPFLLVGKQSYAYTFAVGGVPILSILCWMKMKILYKYIRTGTLYIYIYICVCVCDYVYIYIYTSAISN